jgi:hypothetical protein
MMRARRIPGWVAALVAAAFLGHLLAPNVAAVLPDYGGWQTTGNWKGILGYLRQSGSVPIPGKAHFVWINLCKHNSCAEWVQTGTHQGDFAGGNSPSAVHMFYENVDLCGAYYKADIGVPPAPDTRYLLNYDGAGAMTFSCGGVPTTGYGYEYRTGSSTSTPFFFGVMSTSDGLALAKTEIQGSPIIGNDYFGCDPSLVCTNTAYGMRLFDGSVWSTWTPGLAASVSSSANPPYLHTFNNYWSFRTCAAAC